MEQIDPQRALARNTIQDDARSFALDAARLAQEMRCENVIVIDLQGLSGLSDYFVIGTGTSDRQMIAVVDRLEDVARQRGRRVYNNPDRRSSTWIVADYVDVVVHLFNAEAREYYDLDGLWGDAPRLELPPQTGP